jgi:hypothetical protein
MDFQTVHDGFKAVQNPGGPVYLYETDESALKVVLDANGTPWVAKMEPKVDWRGQPKEGYRAHFRDYDEALAFLNSIIGGGQ